LASRGLVAACLWWAANMRRASDGSSNRQQRGCA